jgi:hypothetical protein
MSVVSVKAEFLFYFLDPTYIPLKNCFSFSYNLHLRLKSWSCAPRRPARIYVTHDIAMLTSGFPTRRDLGHLQ